MVGVWSWSVAFSILCRRLWKWQTVFTSASKIWPLNIKVHKVRSSLIEANSFSSELQNETHHFTSMG